MDPIRCGALLNPNPISPKPSQVWPLLSVPTATMLSGALLASCEDTSRFAAGNQLLERVLRFQQASLKPILMSFVQIFVVL